MDTFTTQRARFTDAKGAALLLIQARQMKDRTYQVLAFHTPKGGRRTRGCVGTFSDAADAQARFDALCAEAVKAKWQPKVRQQKGVSSFDSIPRASA